LVRYTTEVANDILCRNIANKLRIDVSEQPRWAQRRKLEISQIREHWFKYFGGCFFQFLCFRREVIVHFLVHCLK